jgi:hypothetical protein
MRTQIFILFTILVSLTQVCFADEKNEDINSASKGANLVSDIDCCHFKVGAKRINMDNLLESCAVTGQTAGASPPYFDCQSYILGVVEAFQAPAQLVDESKQLCIPKNYETKNLLAIVWNDYEKIWDEFQRTRNEEEYDRLVTRRSASEFIYASLIKRFSCKSNSKPKLRHR